jgi:hypothetical protein
MKKIKRIKTLSVAKIMGLSLAIIGFVVGVVVGFIMFVIGTIFDSSTEITSFLAPGLGILGFILIPVLFGLFGFIMGALCTLIYNRLAAWVGGIEIEFEEIEEK